MNSREGHTGQCTAPGSYQDCEEKWCTMYFHIFCWPVCMSGPCISVILQVWLSLLMYKLLLAVILNLMLSVNLIILSANGGRTKLWHASHVVVSPRNYLPLWSIVTCQSIYLINQSFTLRVNISNTRKPVNQITVRTNQSPWIELSWKHTCCPHYAQYACA